MTQEEIMKLIAMHPDGIMQSEVCREILQASGSGYVSQQITQLRKWGKIHRENVNGKWRLYAISN